MLESVYSCTCMGERLRENTCICVCREMRVPSRKYSRAHVHEEVSVPLRWHVTWLGISSAPLRLCKLDFLHSEDSLGLIPVCIL